MQKSEHVSAIILETVKSKLLFSLGILVAVAGAIATSLFPPLILGKIIHDRQYVIFVQKDGVGVFYENSSGLRQGNISVRAVEQLDTEFFL